MKKATLSIFTTLFCSLTFCTAAQGSSKVTLRSLTLEGLGTSFSAINVGVGVSNINLTVENCVIDRFNNQGIEFVATGTNTLSIEDTNIRNGNGQAISLENPVSATIDNCRLEKNLGSQLSVSGA